MNEYTCPECKLLRPIGHSDDPEDICIYCRVAELEEKVMQFERHEKVRHKHGEV